MGYTDIFKNDLVVTLLGENERLTVSQAEEYARRICLAEQREDYVQMHALIQEALYGQGERHAA